MNTDKHGYQTQDHRLGAVAAAFTEWERRYREEPERFQSAVAKLLKETPESYGAACAPYFLAILAEINGVRPSPIAATRSCPRSEENNEGDTPAPDGIIDSGENVAALPHPCPSVFIRG